MGKPSYDRTGESKRKALFQGTLEIRVEHDGNRFTFKLLHYEHNRNVGDPETSQTVFVTKADSTEDGMEQMKAAMDSYLSRGLF